MSNAIALNHNIRLFFIKSELRAGSLAIPHNLCTVTLDDMVILSTLSQPISAADCAEKSMSLFQWMGSKYTQTTGNIQKRITSFIAAGIVDQAPHTAGAILGSGQQLPLDTHSTPEMALNTDTTYKVSNNFMLRPTQGSFAIWQPASQTYRLLNLAESLVTTCFGSGKTIGTVLTLLSNERQKVEDLTSSISALVANKILLAAHSPEKKPKPKPEPAKPRVSPVATSPKKPAQSLQDLETLVKARIEGAIKQKKKTPIYFVPHNQNHYPLALGMMYSSIKSYKGGMLLKHYHLVPITYVTPNELTNGTYRIHGPGVWFFSNYMWSSDINQEISRQVKNDNSRNIMVHGGPSTPNYEAACKQFMKDNPSVDIAVHGEGELTAVDLLETLIEKPDDLSEVRGITYRSNLIAGEKLIRTESRERTTDLDAFPSPYISGVFDNYGAHIDAAIIESNRGCPFGCTFCDWGSATNQKIRKFDLGRVKNEILWIAKKQVRVLWIADANFGIYDRDIELAKWICKLKEEYGFPREVVVNYTKNATVRLAEIIEVFAENGICSQGIISIQSRDEDTLKVINRKNIKTDKYNDLADIFQNKGLPLSTDLMIGLPGSTVASFADDLQYYFDKDVSVKAYPTQLLPNSPMADPDYIKRYAIKTDSNSILTSTFSYSETDFASMNSLFATFTVAESLSSLRYVLRYLQWDHGINALDYIRKLDAMLAQSPEKYPTINFVMRHFTRNGLALPGGWHTFYQEVEHFTRQHFGISNNEELSAVLLFNESVMPDDMQSYPLEVDLSHDIISYFREQNPSGGGRPLAHFTKASVLIDDPLSFAHITYSDMQYDTHQVFWELDSPLRRHQSVPNFFSID